jgi:hypothetical protein
VVPSLIRGIHLAQVVDVHPKDYEVSVYLPHLPPSFLGKGVRVKLGGRMQRPKAGDFYLPQVGEWGLVAFPQDDWRAGYWLISLPDRGFHIIPQELFEEDPHATLTHYPGGQWRVERGDGSTELAWPDGTSLQVLRKDNPRSFLGRLMDRFRTLRKGKEWIEPKRESLEAPPGPTTYIHLKHASGTEVHLAQDGSVKVTTPSGLTFTLDEGEWAQEEKVTLAHPAGHSLTMTASSVSLHSAGALNITAAGPVVIDGATIAIG